MESEALGTLIINKLHAGIKVGWFCQVSVFGTISVVLIGTVFRSVLSKLLVLEKTDVSVVHFVSLYNSK